jgi:hypothetical protein
VVLSLEDEFAPHLVETLLAFSPESTTAEIASGAAVA